MVVKHSLSEQQYSIISAVVTADRVLPEDQYDIRQLIVELVLFEDIEKPYCTGSILVVDNNGFFDKIGFSGTERIELEIGIEGSFENLKRTFIMRSIANVVKGNQSGNSSVYHITLIDECAFYNRSKRISQSFEGNLETSIVKILKNHLKLDAYSLSNVVSTQTNFKYIIPYMTPFDACEWLRNRATTATGMPYFVWPRLHVPKSVIVSDLETILNGEPVNRDPFIYNPQNTQQSQSADTNVNNIFNIESMKTSSLQDTYQQLTTGSIGATINNLDISTGRASTSHFSLKQMIDELHDRGIINKENQNIYDERYRFSDDFLDVNNLHQSSAMVYHTISSRGTYDTFKSYGEEYNTSKYLTKMKNIAMRNALYKNMIDIEIPGAFIHFNRVGVGDLVRVSVLSDDTDDQEYVFDRLRSGEYLIYNLRHTYRDTVHKVAMTLCKIERGSSDGEFV